MSILLNYTHNLGNYRHNFLLSDHQKERKKTLQVRTVLARETVPVKESYNFYRNILKLHKVIVTI